MANIVSIGLVGGVASGKSLVGKMLVKLGAGMLDADRAGHVVLAEDAEVRRCVLSRWGDAILGKDGKVDRGAVARRVFGKDAGAATERKFLEELLHPRIRERLAHERDQIAAAGKPAVVLDAPLLLEAGWGPMCDVVVMIDSPREARLERAAARGWSEAEFDEREAAQWSVAAKRQRSDVVIPNLGTESDLRRAVVDFWARHVAPTTHKP